MLDDFIRRIVQTVIESFPIDEAKKKDMLRSIVGKEKIGAAASTERAE